MGPNIMCGPCGASTPLHGDGRLCDISAVHLNVAGENQVMIFPRQESLAQGMEIYKLMYKNHKTAPNTGIDGTDIFKTPRNRVRFIFVHFPFFIFPIFELVLIFPAIFIHFLQSAHLQWPELDEEQKIELETKYGYVHISCHSVHQF